MPTVSVHATNWRFPILKSATMQNKLTSLLWSYYKENFPLKGTTPIYACSMKSLIWTWAIWISLIQIMTFIDILLCIRWNVLWQIPVLFTYQNIAHVRISEFCTAVTNKKHRKVLKWRGRLTEDRHHLLLLHTQVHNKR